MFNLDSCVASDCFGCRDGVPAGNHEQLTGHKRKCFDAMADEGGTILSTKGRDTHQGTGNSIARTFTAPHIHQGIAKDLTLRYASVG